ncbi:MAG: hypothetical protein ACXV2J_09260 [Actinomycetes bacterium]
MFRFVAMFLGRKAWEAYQRRRDNEPALAYGGTTGGSSGDRRPDRSRAARVRRRA